MDQYHPLYGTRKSALNPESETVDYLSKRYVTGGLPSTVYSFDDNLNLTKLFDIKPKTDKSEGDDFGRSLTIMDELLIISAPYDSDSGRSFSGSVYGFEEQDQGYEEVWKFNIKHNSSPDISDIGFDFMTNLDSHIKFLERVDFAMNFGEYMESDGRYLVAVGTGRLYLYEILKGEKPRKIKQIVYAKVQPGFMGLAPGIVVPSMFAMKDNLLVVGYGRAYARNTTGAGEVVFFDISSGTPEQSQVYTFPGAVEEEDNFGNNVQIKGNFLRITSSGVDRYNSSGAESFYRIGLQINQNSSSINQPNNKDK